MQNYMHAVLYPNLHVLDSLGIPRNIYDHKLHYVTWNSEFQVWFYSCLEFLGIQNQNFWDLEFQVRINTRIHTSNSEEIPGIILGIPIAIYFARVNAWLYFLKNYCLFLYHYNRMPLDTFYVCWRQHQLDANNADTGMLSYSKLRPAW